MCRTEYTPQAATGTPHFWDITWSWAYYKFTISMFGSPKRVLSLYIICQSYKECYSCLPPIVWWLAHPQTSPPSTPQSTSAVTSAFRHLASSLFRHPSLVCPHGLPWEAPCVNGWVDTRILLAAHLYSIAVYLSILWYFIWYHWPIQHFLFVHSCFLSAP